MLSVLLISACAVLAGPRSYAAIAEYAHDSGRDVLDALQVGAAAPHASTIRRVLQRRARPRRPRGGAALVDPGPARRPGPGPAPAAAAAGCSGEVLALDGKTVRGARRRDGSDERIWWRCSTWPAVQCWPSGRSRTRAVKSQWSHGCSTRTRSDRRAGHRDALHTQRSHADYLHSRSAHYLMTVKANQPRLLRWLRTLPSGAGWGRLPDCGPAATAGSETRAVSVVSLHPTPDLARRGFFSHAAQAIKLVRRRRLHTGRWHTAQVYAITSLPGWQADPVLLAGWIRGHWHIENQLH